MGNINAAVDLQQDGDVAVIVMDNPPVNALGYVLRGGLMQAMEAVRAKPEAKAVVLIGTPRAFSGGADITEFGTIQKQPLLPEVIAVIEAFDRPVIAAMSGVALGGGLELALGCHYRVAAPGSKLGLPEVKLGILPGAGGTQRLPRLMGPVAALKAIVAGTHIPVEKAEGLVDAMCATREEAVAFARSCIGKPLARVRDRDEKLQEARANPGLLDEAAAPLLKRARGQLSPAACVQAVMGAVNLPFDEGLALERKLFRDLVNSKESRAQRHAFFAEREATKVPGMPAGLKAAPVKKAAIIGAGTMGGGIAMCFANAGIPVTIVELKQDALDRGMGVVEKNYRTAVSRGSMQEGDVAKRMALFTATTDWSAIADADVVIEAVFETMEVKREVFTKLDAIAKPGALLASNTSTLDVDQIASFTKRPQDVLGMHFFSPANVMKLLEIVRGKASSYESLARALAIGRAIGKVSAVVGVCDGFVGNRMLHKRSAQAEALLLEGALPQQVDAVVTKFGFPMGPYAMGDLAGLDVGWRIRQGRGTTAPIADALCEAGRYGQKTNAGYYKYDGRTPSPDPEVQRIIAEQQRKLGVNPRTIGDDEIFERMFYPMINEGARILEEGIATRPSDIDVIWMNGYGWPIRTGGPMHYADTVGLKHIADRLDFYADRNGDETLRPAKLLRDLANQGAGFAPPTKAAA
ncbi:3-hydroxyacyl-CoA dehydrogenase NAD-binding domain-containing protein [Acidisphaera sp. L21]|uniref:3-hydroxyacyl-CoA dehydrogenase NAD-binding domain-containing protein n=1 Tax=Acidisphaera sp. L21 TaxID=1641851 RepID=UPI001C20C023|nr:3-hydroxyacyl-CoA dehydrogenase NAD-binding domain-containing protein [Acidisphaera sp. L21]